MHNVVHSSKNTYIVIHVMTSVRQELPIAME